MTPNITEWPKNKLNKAIAKLAYPNAELTDYPMTEGVIIGPPQENRAYLTVDYLDNWNDLMPLAELHHISSDFDYNNDSWYADSWIDCKEFKTCRSDKKRAIAECLYMVLLAKSKEQDNASS